jgi:hypothetical protein
MTTLVKMDMDTWSDKYQPVLNLLGDNPSLDDGNGGIMFETYGREVDFVRGVTITNPRNVWTYIDGSDGQPLVVNGWHLVNRIGYLITAVPAEPETFYEISI